MFDDGEREEGEEADGTDKVCDLEGESVEDEGGAKEAMIKREIGRQKRERRWLIYINTEIKGETR